jgi:ATP-dependent DNA helicase RecG
LNTADSIRLEPSTPLTSVEWVPRAKTPSLQRLGLATLSDLVTHYPRRYEDRRRFDHFPDEELDRPVCLLGVVAKTAVKRFGGWRRMFEIIIENPSAGALCQPISCRWFNLPYVQKMVSTGQQIVVFGRPKKRGRQIVIDHPEFEMIEEDEEFSVHMNRITPVHPAGEGISPRVLRVLIHRALSATALEDIPHLWPGATGSKADALREIHFPESFQSKEIARQLLAREEFLAIQLLISARRSEWLQLSGVAKAARGELVGQLVATLPFALTDSQRQVIKEIRQDLAMPHRMNRLLQGDVGSGKTLVALASMLLTVEAGWQAAIMAPTQILAEQHYLNFQKFLAPLGLRVALRTASKKEAKGGKLVIGKSEAPQIVVGTHALLHEKKAFNRLGLVVIDEQHKFGVLQRAQLIERGDTPDVLVMTATPIPRTLTQTIYGDLDVSVLKDKPANRGVIQTAVRDAEKLPEVVDFLRKQLDKGRQAYIVYALVDESEKLAAKSASAEFEKWKEHLFPYQVGLVHGRLSPEEKEGVMESFRKGDLSALVATTVIEVGVDVPNANIMLVENAERFGLAQLHQLRGRVGRGEHKSYCILLYDTKAQPEAIEKLAVLEKTADGFEIAEADLRLRGPGDLLGTAQTGLPPLKLADLFRDADLMAEARRLAGEILERDPLLAKPEHRALKGHLDRSATKKNAANG